MKDALPELLDTATAAAAAAARVIAEAAAGPRRVDHKGAVDLVTEVDLAAEAAIRAVLHERSPGIPVLAEEGGGATKARTRWIVDPLDGTTNFVHGIPHYAVVVALELEGELAVGCVHDVVRDQVYQVVRGGGARCDGQPIAVSQTRSLQQALLATGFPYDRQERPEVYLAYVEAFLRRSQGIRRLGSAALDLCYVAAGRFDGFWEFGLAPWDVAAGMLLIQEAGGQVTDLGGGSLDLAAPRPLATNGLLHAEMSAVLAALLSSGRVPPGRHRT